MNPEIIGLLSDVLSVSFDEPDEPLNRAIAIPSVNTVRPVLIQAKNVRSLAKISFILTVTSLPIVSVCIFALKQNFSEQSLLNERLKISLT